MSTSSHAPSYDLFKLIVAIILLLVFLIMIWMQPGQSPQPISSITTSTLPPVTETIRSTQTAATVSSTSIPPTNTPLPSDTPTQTATPKPSPTEAITEEPLPTPIVEIPSGPEACAAISQSQLQVGMRAVIQRWLNLRSYPGLFHNLILTNPPGTEVEIVGGPACTRYISGGAYLWWQIKLPNGSVGWSAEASAFGTFYFMEPIK